MTELGLDDRSDPYVDTIPLAMAVEMLLSSESVTPIEKRICHPELSPTIIDAASASAFARSLALSFFVGGLSALRYFPTVSRAMPRVREMARRDSPCYLARWTASHRAC